MLSNAPKNPPRRAYHRAYYRKHRDRLLGLAHHNHRERRTTKRRFPFLDYLKRRREEWEQGVVVLYFD
jgi:hypothetical protein